MKSEKRILWLLFLLLPIVSYGKNNDLQVKITSVEYTTGKLNKWISTKLTNQTKIFLDKRCNNIKISYQLLNPSSSLKNVQYETMMIYGNQTLKEVTNGISFFPNLYSRDYEFQVRVKTDDGEEGIITKLPLYIKPLIYEQWWFQLLGFFVGLVFLVLLSNYRFKRQTRNYMKQLVLERQIANLRLKTLHSQMNSHFFANVMTAIQSYILTEDKFVASEYLGQFSHLMRKFIENSKQKEITIEEEMEFLKEYVELEQLRFPDRFDIEFHVDENIKLNTKIPASLLQTYVENAINHGILSKENGQGLITVDFKLDPDNRRYLFINIMDNGIGIKRSKEIESSEGITYRSNGMKIMKERVEVLKETRWNIDMNIGEAYPEELDCGTKISFKMRIRRNRRRSSS